jgi:transcription-repair coupling factor (superfamily II helicase)
MTLSDLRQITRSHPAVSRISDLIRTVGTGVRLTGLSGAGVSLVADKVSDADGGVHLFVLNDKEGAAYFLNDLENLRDGKQVLFFPESYRHPYQTEDTDNSNVVLRAEVLNRISESPKKLAIVTYPAALSEKVVTRKHLQQHTLEIRKGISYSIDFINEVLLEYEFDKVDFVFNPGQFAIRGGIVDVFSFSNDHPYRIVFDGDDVESIRMFDPSTQLSVAQMDHIAIVPNVQRKLLQESRQSFLEFLPESTTVWLWSAALLRGALDEYCRKAQTAYDKINSPLAHLTPVELYVDGVIFFHQLQGHTTIEVGDTFRKDATEIAFEQQPQPGFSKNFELLMQDLRKNTKAGYTNVILSNQPKQIERLYAIFEDIGKDVEFKPITIALHSGFIDHTLKLACYTDHQIFDRYHRFRLKEGFRRTQETMSMKELASLQKGDFVVHVDHGVGVFSGLEKINVNGKEQEAIRLVYDGNDILYVSIHSLHRISKYTGKEGTHPKLHKLGSNAWANTKAKTKKKIKEIAYDLIKLYAKRKASNGFAFHPDTYLQTELEASFIYEDTPDQEKATAAVKKDMEEPFPMDRLICGDVGFGKTEIAIRAAFKAATDGKQVAILVPTTILSLQHYKSFSERLRQFPVKVDYINRFKSAGKQKETLDNLANGKVDIVIGTHKLVSKGVKFKDLGLLIIDEEQKFGVAVKDKLKTMREHVDTLTLTATPIPRTLQFSLMGARDLSIINTPPPNRHPVQTELHAFTEEFLRDAVTYEIQRGGQVYVVNNRIQNIQEVAGMIQRLCPNVRIAIGHGQMDGDKLEEVMLDFMDGQYDVLVATSIIESGIDVPNANTMIIYDAHMFGLSDLHQLRGRVGRSNRKAFCYLFTPPLHHLTTEARKRLHAIEQFSHLGSGFSIAMRDLDIRGAGNLLGAEQSGFIADIGMEMYQKILDEAMQELRKEEFHEVFPDQPTSYQVSDCVIETDLEIMIPDDYVNVVAERLQLYRELDELTDEKALQVMQHQLEDRFGPIPEPLENLLDTIRMRWLAKDLGLEKVVLKSRKLIAYFGAPEDSDFYQGDVFGQVLLFVRDHGKKITLSEKAGKLRLVADNVSSVEEIVALFSDIVTPVKIQ